MKRKIVVIEPHTSIRELLAAELGRDTAYEVVGQVGSGWEGIALCRRLQPSLAIVGLPLPDLGGAEALRQLRGVTPAGRFLIYSGLRDRSHIARVMRAGPDGFVDRDETLANLRVALAAAARGARYFSPMAAVSITHRPRPVASGGDGGRLPGLSGREREVLCQVALGRSSKEISADLGLSVRTVENHRANVRAKLGVRAVADLTRFALGSGLVHAG